MRRLGLLSLLCLGLVVLLACWLVAVVVVAGLLGRVLSGWILLGIPLAVALLFVGALLLMAAGADAESDDGPVSRALVGAVIVAIPAGIVAAITLGVSGPQIYHERYGERTTAVVSYVGALNGENGVVTGWMYHVRDHRTDEVLGVLALGPAHDTAEDDRIEVSVDPRGWVPPVPVDRLGGTTVPAVILLCALGATVLAALAVIAAALVEAVRGRYRSTGVPCSNDSR